MTPQEQVAPFPCTETQLLSNSGEVVAEIPSEDMGDRYTQINELERLEASI